MKKYAFTLAEIMITIGIIGVVAAITIPLLIQNSNSKKFTTQFKKSLSTLNQAAIGAQAQYDLDYSLLTQINDDATCKSNTLAGGQYNFCGLFNNTLAGHTYLGKYGNVKGANLFSPYSADMKSFSVENFLFFSFADGAIVAFNPNAKNCGIGVGQTLTNEKLTTNLANCIGFIDVNGTTPPNKEVQCAEGTTTISANTTCKVTNGSMGDIFPVVFHDGAVEPATNASLAAFLGGNGKEQELEDKILTVDDMPCFHKHEGSDKCIVLSPIEDFEPMSYNDCMAQKEELGLDYCSGADNPTEGEDYYAAAAKACGGKQNLPSFEDLQNLANDLFQSKSGAELDAVAEELGFTSYADKYNRRFVAFFSNTEVSADTGGSAYIGANNLRCIGGANCWNYSGRRKGKSHDVICVKHDEGE